MPEHNSDRDYEEVHVTRDDGTERTEVKRHADGSVDFTYTSPDTIGVGKGTPEKPLPELLLNNPRRAAELLFGLEAPTHEQQETPNDAELPELPETFSSVAVDVPEGVNANRVISSISMQGIMAMRSGSRVTFRANPTNFKKVWNVLQQFGIGMEHVTLS